MSFNSTDNTNRLSSGAITLPDNQSVPRDLDGDSFVAAQGIPFAGLYSLCGDTLPPYACPPSDHQLSPNPTTPYEPLQSLVHNFRTDMDLDSNHQQVHAAMRGDVNQQIPEPLSPLFEVNSESMLSHSATMGTPADGIRESSLATAYHLMPAYRVGNNRTFTGMYGFPQCQPPFNDESINNEQPPYYSCNSEVGSIHPSPNMAIEGPISANYNPMLASENINSLTTFTPTYNGDAAIYHLMSKYAIGYNFSSTYNAEHQPLISDVFTNNVQSSPLMTQQALPHAYSEQPYHPSNMAVTNIHQSPTMTAEIPTSVNPHLALDENTNMYSRVSDGNTAYWRCNISGCSYVTRSTRDIKRHCSKLEHGGHREHECGFCGKAFGRKDTLKRHIRETRCWLRWLASTVDTA